MNVRALPFALPDAVKPASGESAITIPQSGVKGRVTPCLVPPLPDLAQRPRLLLVEDEAAIRRALARRLHGRYEIVIAEDGATAAELVTHQVFDVVLSDVNLPGITGVELLRLIRSLDPETQVVLMTGNPNVEIDVAAIELGAVTCIAKPYEGRVLDAALERATKLAHLARMTRTAASEALRGASTLGATFARALESLSVVFQPIVDRRSRQTVGYEALMRAREPAMPSPCDLISAAETLGRTHELGRAVRKVAARTFEPADPNALLFVNLHPVDLRDPSLFDPQAPLSKIASNVVLEITERAAISETSEVQRATRLLRGMGYRIAVDDLGAGYAGLATVAALEPEIVKLDMSLIRGIEVSPVRGHLVKCMTDLCRDLDMKVVAEGIESSSELARLLELNVDYLQGYLLGRPRPTPITSPYRW